MTVDLDHLESIAKAAPHGRYEVWTSNSWHRVYADQGRDKVRVIEPYLHGHVPSWPDLAFGPGVEAWLEGFTPEVALALIAEVRALRDVCAAVYQLAGTMNAPIRFLDALSDASNGEIEARAKTDDLLPVSPDEVGSFLSDEGQEYREDADRLAWWFSFYPPKSNDFVNVYLKGMAERWSLDQWRAAIDAARKEEA